MHKFLCFPFFRCRHKEAVFFQSQSSKADVSLFSSFSLLIYIFSILNIYKTENFNPE